MKPMASDSSAPTCEQAPHASETTNTTQASDVVLTTLIRRTRTASIINALKERALSVLNDKSIDAQSRAVIRYALETNDPWLAELVRRAEKGETAGDSIEPLARDSAQS
jgi:hypothetical protein